MDPAGPPTRGDGGEAVLALVLNGLGFVSRPLYLTPVFFETKPVVNRNENSPLLGN